MSEPIIHVALSGNRVFELTSTGRLLSFSKRDLVDTKVNQTQSVVVMYFKRMLMTPNFCLPTDEIPSDRQQLFYANDNTLFVQPF